MDWNKKAVRGLLAALMLLGSAPAPVMAQEAAAIDAAMDQLLKLEPGALVTHLAEMRQTAEAQAQEAAALRQQAEALTGKVTAMEGQLDSLMKHVEALAKSFNMMAPPAAPADAPVMEAKAETEMAAPLTNYADHVKPIFEQRCAKCHNPDTRKSGLALTTMALLNEGGSSGPVIAPGDPDGSRLVRLIMQTEEPVMPPSGDPLTPEQIEIVRKWIADGAPADSSAKPATQAKKEGMAEDAGTAFVAATFADTPPLPEVQLDAPVPLPKRGVVARALDTSPRAPLVAVGGNRQVLLYQLENNTLLGALPFPEGDIYALTFSVNGEVLLAGGGEEGNSGIAVAWNVRTGERMGTYGGAYDTVLAADISPDHRMVVLGGPNRKVRAYDAANGAELYTLDAHADWIYAVKFTPDGEVLATADRGGNLYLWQAANGRKVEQLSGHNGPIHALAYTYDSTQLASAGADGTVQLWDTWKYSRIRSFKAHDAPVHFVDISADGKIVTTSSDANTRIFGLDGNKIKDLAPMPDWGYQACFDYQSKTVLAGSWTGEIFVWNLESGEKVAALATDPVAAAK